MNLLRRPSGWLLAAAILFGGALHARSAASPVIQQPPATPAPSGPSSASSQPVATDDEVKARCTPCHKLPPPDILPRSAWRDEMVRMMLIEEGVPEPAGATSFLPLSPDWLRLWRYYDRRAPEKLPEPEPWPAVEPRRPSRSSGDAGRRHGGQSGAVAIANVRLFDVDGDKRLDILASEMRTGPVLLGLAKEAHALKPIARLTHPAHIEPVDLDKDGRGDFLVADLGLVPAGRPQRRRGLLAAAARRSARS